MTSQPLPLLTRMGLGSSLGFLAGLGIILMGWITDNPVTFADDWVILLFSSIFCFLAAEISYQLNKDNQDYHYFLGDKNKNKLYQAMKKAEKKRNRDSNPQTDNLHKSE